MKKLELLSIILSIATVGITLGAVVIGSNANLRSELRTEMESLRVGTHADVQELRSELRAEMENLRAETRSEVQELRAEMRAEMQSLRKDVRAVEGRLSALEQRQARTEGLLEALRDAIADQGLPEPRGENEAT